MLHVVVVVKVQHQLRKEKSKAKGCLVTVLVLLVLVAVGGYFGYGYVQDSLKPVDASSKDYVTVQIPDGANVQEIGSTLKNLVWLNMDLSLVFMLNTIAMPT